MARTTGSDAQRNAHYREGYRDADEYDEPHYIGALNTPEEEKYNEGFYKRKKENEQ